MPFLKDFVVTKWHGLIGFSINTREPVGKKSINIDARFAIDNVLGEQHARHGIVPESARVEVDTNVEITQSRDWTYNRVRIHGKADQADPMVIPFGALKEWHAIGKILLQVQ